MGFEYADETWFVVVPPQGIMNPQPGAGWSEATPRNRATRKKGQETFTAFLSLDVKEQRVSRYYAEHTNQTETLAFVKERIAAHERQGHSVLVMAWDDASWHKAKNLMRAIREHNKEVCRTGAGTRFAPVRLPVHAFWLNPVEPIIKHTKQRALPCRQFEGPEEQKTALDRHWLHRNLHQASVPGSEDLFSFLH